MSRSLSLHHLRNIGLFGVSKVDEACVKKAIVPSATTEMKPKSVPSRSLRVLSFNVLFPNSETSGVWWIYKYYNCDHADSPIENGRVDISDWQHRKLLLQQIVERIDADIVCFQEPWNSRGVPKVGIAASKTNEEDIVQATFMADFAFMKTLGYENELCGKGQIRTATFWKIEGRGSPPSVDEGVCPSRSIQQKPLGLKRVSSSSKANRALVSLFEITLPDDAKQHLAVVNCHLTADPTKVKDRVSTVEGGIKEAAKLHSAIGNTGSASAPKGKKGGAAETPASPVQMSVIVCGDFNSVAEGPVDAFLTEGEVGPDAKVDLKKKVSHNLPKFIDCGVGRGPTFVASNVDTLIMRPAEQQKPLPAGLAESANLLEGALKNATGGRCDENGEMKIAPFMDNAVLRALNEQRLMPEMLKKVRQCFDIIRATPLGLPEGTSLSEEEISGQQVMWWLQGINGGKRGTEFRRAREIQLTKCSLSGLDLTSDDNLLPSLTFQEFATVVRHECEEGKYWGVEHDLQKLCGNGMRKAGDVSFQERFDYIYISSASDSTLRLATADVVAFFPKAVGGDDKLKSLVEIGSASGGIDSFVLPNSWHPSDHLPIVAEFVL